MQAPVGLLVLQPGLQHAGAEDAAVIGLKLGCHSRVKFRINPIRIARVWLPKAVTALEADCQPWQCQEQLARVTQTASIADSQAQKTAANAVDRRQIQPHNRKVWFHRPCSYWLVQLTWPIIMMTCMHSQCGPLAVPVCHTCCDTAASVPHLL